MKDTRTHKHCSKCGELKLNNEDNFQLDSAKVKKGHTIILASACRPCKNKMNRALSQKHRDYLRAIGTTMYQQLKAKDPNWNKKCNEREKKYVVKKAERQKRYRAEGREYAINKEFHHKKNKKHVDGMSDYYISRLMTRNSAFPPKYYLQFPELIAAWREQLKLKRLCLQKM